MRQWPRPRSGTHTLLGTRWSLHLVQPVSGLMVSPSWLWFGAGRGRAGKILQSGVSRNVASFLRGLETRRSPGVAGWSPAHLCPCGSWCRGSSRCTAHPSAIVGSPCGHPQHPEGCMCVCVCARACVCVCTHAHTHTPLLLQFRQTARLLLHLANGPFCRPTWVAYSQVLSTGPSHIFLIRA